MTSNSNRMPPPVVDQPSRRPPVRVKLAQADAYIAKTYPPDGESQDWWRRLNQALGTVSSDFTNASLLQVQAAADTLEAKAKTLEIQGHSLEADAAKIYGKT